MRFEPLEDRRLLAFYTVTNLTDAPVTGPASAPGTLRQAIYDANNSAGADVIDFAPGLSGVVSLSSSDDSTNGLSALHVNSEITIRGNSNGITIGRDIAAPEMRLIFVTSTGNLALETISLTGGLIRGTNGTAPGENGGAARGGAVFNQGTLHISASTIYGNQAIGGAAGPSATGGLGLGGAIFNENGALTVVNSTLSGNAVQTGTEPATAHTSSFGGGIYSVNGNISIRNTTITNSTAATGRGIYVLANGVAAIEIQSSIVGQNGAVSTQARELVVAQDNPQQLSVTGSNNLIRMTVASYGYLSVTTEDPQLGPLALNGGPTMTHAISAGTPAIDQGANLQSLGADQRGGGYSRVVGTAADVGAFEFQTVQQPELPGDYNSSHFVDAADYVLWRKNNGTSVAQYSGADGDGSGVVDAGDYSVWRAHFGATASAAAAGTSAPIAAALPIPDGNQLDTGRAAAVTLPGLASALNAVTITASGSKGANRHTVTNLVAPDTAARDKALLSVPLLANNRTFDGHGIVSSTFIDNVSAIAAAIEEFGGVGRPNAGNWWSSLEAEL